MMETDRRFLILCAGEVLIVALGNLAAALILQILILGALLDDRRGYWIFVPAAALYAAVIAASGRIILPLLALAVALGCGYLALSLQDYRLSLRAGGGA